MSEADKFFKPDQDNNNNIVNPKPNSKICHDAVNKSKLPKIFDSTTDRKKLDDIFEALQVQQKVTASGKIAFVDPNSIEVKDFDIHTIPEYSSLAVIGASESGKSNWVAWALAANNHLPWYNVFTGTASNGFWQHFFPVKAVVQGFDTKRAVNTLAHQANILPMKDQFNIRMGTILDDLQGTKEWIKPVTSLYLQGRHFEIQTFAMVQTKNGLFKHMRLNTKVVIVFRLLSHTERKEIAQQWMGDWNLTTAIGIISKYTTDHHGLIIDTRTSPPKLFVTKAPDMMAIAKRMGKHKPFAVFLPLGSKAFWASDTRGSGSMTSFKGDVQIAAGVPRPATQVKFDTPEAEAEAREAQDVEVANPNAPPAPRSAHRRRNERVIRLF